MSDLQLQHLSIPGGRIAYRRLGAAAGTPLLLLHRFRGTIDHWDPQLLDALARERPVIVFDSLGVGGSTGEVPPTIDGMAAVALAVLDALDLAAADVLGWSMGGAVAQRMALARPSSVRRLVLAGTGPGGVPEAPPAPSRVWEVAGKPENEDEDFLYLFFAETETSREAGRASLARIAPQLRRSGSTVGLASVQRQAAAIRAWSTGQDAARPRLAEIAAPTLVANGAHDVMVHAYHSFVLAQGLPNAELVLYPDSGHGFLFQHTARFAARVLELLRDDGA